MNYTTGEACAVPLYFNLNSLTTVLPRGCGDTHREGEHTLETKSDNRSDICGVGTDGSVFVAYIRICCGNNFARDYRYGGNAQMYRGFAQSCFIGTGALICDDLSAYSNAVQVRSVDGRNAWFYVFYAFPAGVRS